jgi:uncharacterized protein (TIGR03435 family)
MKRTVVAALFSTLSFFAFAQPAAVPEFEVASIRVASTDVIRDSYTPTLNVAPGATLRMTNLRLREIILLAYNIGRRQLVGPGWLIDDPIDPTDFDRFDIVAKVPANATKDQIPLMLQKLVADRFHLAMHKDSKTLSTFALNVAKGGLKMETAAEGDRRVPGCRRNMYGVDGITTAVCQSMTTAQLAQQLQTLAPAYFKDAPVVDRTGLTKTYDFTLGWLTLAQLDAGEQGPSLFDAVGKLGLTLDRQKDTVEVYVVDRCDKLPTEN